MSEALEKIRDGLSQIGDDPVVRGALVAGAGLLALLTWGLAVFRGRRKAADRVDVRVNAPANADVTVQTRKTE